VIYTLGRLASRVGPRLHERLDDLALVEDSITDDERRVECDTLLPPFGLVGVARVAPKTPDIGVVTSRGDPKDDLLAIVIEHWLNDLRSVSHRHPR
jgi:hypothetical protein